MSRPSSKAIYSKFFLHPLSLALRMLPTPHCLGLTWAFSPPPTLSPAVHRKEYLHNLASEPASLQHRVEVSNPGPRQFPDSTPFSWCPRPGPKSDTQTSPATEPAAGPAGQVGSGPAASLGIGSGLGRPRQPGGREAGQEVGEARTAVEARAATPTPTCLQPHPCHTWPRGTALCPASGPAARRNV